MCLYAATEPVGGEEIGAARTVIAFFPTITYLNKKATTVHPPAFIVPDSPCDAPDKPFHGGMWDGSGSTSLTFCS